MASRRSTTLSTEPDADRVISSAIRRRECQRAAHSLCFANGGATDCERAVSDRSGCETAGRASSSAQQPVKLETERDDGADEAGVTGTSVPGCLALLLGEFALGQLTLNIAGHASSLGCLVV